MLVNAQISKSPLDWDLDLKNKGDLLQTTYWGVVLNKLDKAKPIFIEVFDGDIIIVKWLVFHCIPWDRNLNSVRKGFKGYLMRKGFIRAYGAPVFFTDDKYQITMGTHEIIQWVESYAKDEKLLFIELMETYDRHYVSSTRLDNYEEKKWATLIVDLCQDNIWNGISGAARKSINKAKREGITVKRIDGFEEYIDLYIKNYNLFNGRKTLDIDIENSKIAWDQDSNTHYYYYYVAQKESQVIGMLGMYVFNGVATEIMSALSPDAFEKKLPAQDLLHWEMFTEAMELGCHSFDLSGINPAPQTPKENGIRRFKEKWNGSYVEYNKYLKITKPFFAWIYIYYRKFRGIKSE